MLTCGFERSLRRDAILAVSHPLSREQQHISHDHDNRTEDSRRNVASIKQAGIDGFCHDERVTKLAIAQNNACQHPLRRVKRLADQAKSADKNDITANHEHELLEKTLVDNVNGAHV